MGPNFFIPEISVVQKIVRPLGVYLFLLIAFRFFGKRELLMRDYLKHLLRRNRVDVDTDKSGMLPSASQSLQSSHGSSPLRAIPSRSNRTS